MAVGCAAKNNGTSVEEQGGGGGTTPITISPPGGGTIPPSSPVNQPSTNTGAGNQNPGLKWVGGKWVFDPGNGSPAIEIGEGLPSAQALIQAIRGGQRGEPIPSIITRALMSTEAGRNFLKQLLCPTVEDTGAYREVGFANAIHLAILSRLPTKDEVDRVVNDLRRGRSRLSVVQQLVTSQEGVHKSIQATYQHLLGRPAEGAGLSYWEGVYRSANRPLDAVISGISQSDEYVTRKGGTLAGWINGLYIDHLQRNAEPAGMQYWMAVAPQGRPAVADGILESDEQHLRRIYDYYRAFLGREPEQGGQQFWLNHLRNGLDIDAFRWNVIGSDEYWNKVQPAQTQKIKELCG